MADRSGQHFGNYRLVRSLGTGRLCRGVPGPACAAQSASGHQGAACPSHREPRPSTSSRKPQTIATLVHPSIIRIFDFDVQDGVPFPGDGLRPRWLLAPALSQGEPGSLTPDHLLREAGGRRLAVRPRAEVHPPRRQAGEYAAGPARGGIALRLWHRDLAHSSGSLSTQEAVGTLAYMAPEQIEGHPRAASDQYALGVRGLRMALWPAAPLRAH